MSDSKLYALTHAMRGLPYWEVVLRVCLALQLVGAALLMVNFDGSALAKYAAKQVDLREANDEQIMDYMSGELFDDAPHTDAPQTTPTMSYQTQDRIYLTDQILGYCFFALAVWVLLAPHSPLLILIALWFAINAWAGMKNGGDTYTHLSLPGQAVRYLAPIALLIMQRQRKRQNTQSPSVETHANEPHQYTPRFAEALLRIAVASVFLVHGMEAFLRYWVFQNLLINSSQNIGIELSLETANVLLMVIGAMDIALALLLLIGRLRRAVMWMAIWAFIAALSRMTSLGWEGHPETLLRMLNAGTPLALVLLWKHQGRSCWPHWLWHQTTPKQPTPAQALSIPQA